MIALLEPTIAIVRLLVIFTLILVLIKRKWSLGNAFVLGALGLGLIFGMQPLAVLRSCGRALVDPKTMSLSLVVSLIPVPSHSLEQSGWMERLLNRFKGMIRPICGTITAGESTASANDKGAFFKGWRPSPS